LAGVDSIDAATALRGHQVYFKIPGPSSSSEAFYAEEIIGFTVEDKQAGKIGLVTGVSGIPENRLIEIAGDSGEILLPLNSPFFIQLDKQKKWLQVDLPEGYLSI
jgi:16S rRNA processing protein RimM